MTNKYKIYTEDREDFRRVLRILLENGFVFTERRYKTLEEAEFRYKIDSCGVPFTGRDSESARWHWILIGCNEVCSRVLEPCVPSWPNKDFKDITLLEFLKIKDNY